MKLKDYITLLDEYPVKQFPKAGIFIVNQLAFEARKTAVRQVQKRMITRSKFVTNRIQFSTSPRTKDFKLIQSEMGALKSIDFMADQEYGYLKKPKQGSKLPVPTRAARTGKSIRRKKRPIYHHNRLGTLKNISQYKGKTKRQKIIAMLQDMARKKDKRAALIPFSRKPGIYVIKNIRKKGKKKTSFQFKLHKLYDLRKRQMWIKPNPWMRPTLKIINRKRAKIAEIAWQRFLSKI